jgi:hypothetical protein
MNGAALLGIVSVIGIALAFTAQSPSIIPFAGAASSARVCLAALMSEFGWSGNVAEGKSRIGKYSGARGDTHVFASRSGLTECRVVDNRVMWRTPRRRWRDNPYFDTTLTYRAAGDSIEITSVWGDGTSKVESYSENLLAQHTR